MKILVNAANTFGGGSVQKAVEFVRSSVSRRGAHTFSYALSSVVAESLQDLDCVEGLDLTTFDVSPARPVGGLATRRSLQEIERRFQPDVVYSVFGPAYVRFRSPHLTGFAVAWVTHPNQHAWRAIRNPLKRLRHSAWCQYVAYWIRFADRWVLETAVAADGLSRVLGLPRDRFHVVPNTCGEQYSRARDSSLRPDPRMARQSPQDFHLLVFSHWYPHKNLELIPSVAAELRRRDPVRRHRFFLTFDTASAEWEGIRRNARRLRVEDNVVNIGPVLVGDGPGLYASSDIMFLPTLLETFTATYPEAMCSRKPIVTTDLPFARDVCGDAALYFAPNDAVGGADRIALLARSDAARAELVRKGEERFASLMPPGEAYDRFIDLLEHTARSRA